MELTINVNADGTPAADTVKVFAYDANSDDDDDPNTTPTDVSRSGQTLEFGVDTTAPVIEVDDEEETRFAAVPFEDPDGLELLASDDQGDVGDSGLLTTGGILVQAERRTATKSDCAAIQANGTRARRRGQQVQLHGDHRHRRQLRVGQHQRRVLHGEREGEGPGREHLEHGQPHARLRRHYSDGDRSCRSGEHRGRQDLLGARPT